MVDYLLNNETRFVISREDIVEGGSSNWVSLFPLKSLETDMIWIKFCSSWQVFPSKKIMEMPELPTFSWFWVVNIPEKARFFVYSPWFLREVEFPRLLLKSACWDLLDITKRLYTYFIVLCAFDAAFKIEIIWILKVLTARVVDESPHKMSWHMRTNS